MKIICFIIPVLCAIETFGQSQVSFRQLSVNDGLSQNSVVSVAQDSTGYLWIATQDGLNKYDGNKFEIYSQSFLDVTKPTYSHLGKVYVDREGNIITIPASNKPRIYDKATNSFIPFSNIQDVSVLYQDSKRNYWFGTYASGLFKKDVTTKDVSLVVPKDSIGTIFAISEDKKGSIWLVGQGKVMCVNNENDTIDTYFPDSNNQSNVNYSNLLFDDLGTVWLGSYGNGMWIKHPESSTFKSVKAFSPNLSTLPNDLYVLSMHLDKKNRLWIGTYGRGLYKIDLNTSEINHFETKKHNPRAIHYNDILCIFEDYTGTLWFGTDGAGVSFYDEYLEKFNVINNYQTPEEISIDLVRAIQIDKNNNVWIGTSGKGLSRYTPKTHTWKTYVETKGGLSSNRVVSLFIDDDNELWIGTQGGGLNIMHTNGKISHYNNNTPVKLNVGTIWDIFKDESNNIWLSTRDHGLILFNKHKGVLKQFNKSNGLISNNIRVTIQGEADKLWVGTEDNGVLLLDTKTKTFIDFKKDFNLHGEDVAKKVKSLYYDKKGLLWVGTNGKGLGVYDLKNKAFYNYTVNDGLPNNVIYGILPDSENNLWLSSNRGITMFKPAPTLDNKPQIVNYDNYDGLATEFNTGAYYKSANNDLYFGGLEGYYWFNPSLIKKSDVIPKTVITGFEVFNHQLQMVDSTQLHYNENTVSFTFSSLQFSLPKKNNYLYKLENHDENWILSNGVKRVRYTNLAPGNYRFLVKSSNYDGLWNEKPAGFYFIINKPWYLNNWMLSVYAVLIICSLLLAYYYFKWRWEMTLNLKEEREKSERLKRLDEYKTKLYTNIAHEFRTPLTLISAPIKKQLLNNNLQSDSKKDLQLIEHNTTQLLSLVDQLLELSKLESGAMRLKVKQNDLGLYLKVISQSFQFLAEQNNLKLSVHVPEIKNAWFDSDVVERLVNNLFSNAIKYTSKGGVISFNVEHVYKKEVKMVFINDIDAIIEKEISKIFNRFYQINENSEGSGIGLSLVKELTNLSHGTIEASYADHQKIKFVIKLPISKESFLPDEIDLANLKNDDITLPTNNLPQNSSKPIALVVDNNQDIRQFVKSLLIDDFKVIEAKNGLEGIEKAFKTIPDIIVSDVMMPLKNGLELCEILKHDEKTSHIPIILLTGKTGDINEIEGLNTGADDYITKPFNPKTLQIKVNNIIEGRRKLRERYKKDIVFKPKDMATTPADEMFLKKVQNILDQYVSNPDFNAEFFSKQVGMSRMQLHRKLLAFTGLNTTAFIRSQRLKQAIQILKSSNHTVNEVAYMVGFNTPSYFIKCFKEMYGQTPLEYIK